MPPLTLALRVLRLSQTAQHWVAPRPPVSKHIKHEKKNGSRADGNDSTAQFSSVGVNGAFHQPGRW